MATTITVVCPHCTNQMRASSDHIGQRGRCPSCKQLVTITQDDSGPSGAIVPANARKKSSTRTTDVPGWLAGLIGVAATLLVYLTVFLPLSGYKFGQLFVARGVIPYVAVLVTFWGLATLALKLFAVRRQKSYAELELEFIPLEIGVQITASNVDQFLDHLGKCPPLQRGSILGRRISGALEHFKSRNNVPEVQEYLATQAEIDGSDVDSGYTLLRVFIWMVPILGFIGTVMGISDAVSGLSTTLGAGDDIMTGLGQVTTGLSTAFDTTLVALVLAILLLVPTETLRKSEYRMLDRIESFCGESLLRRMSDERIAAGADDLPDVVKFALEGAFQEHQRWLAQWQNQVGQLGQVIGADFERAVTQVEQARAKGSVDAGRWMETAAAALKESANQAAVSIERMANTEQQVVGFFDRIANVSENLERSVGPGGAGAPSAGLFDSDSLKSLNQSVAQLNSAIQTLNQAISSETINSNASEGPDDVATMVLPVDANHRSGGILGFLRRKK